MKTVFSLLALVCLLLISTNTLAGVGRYQAIVVPPTSQTANRPVLIILDTEEGHIWEKLLVEKPWYCGQVKPPTEKGFWQGIGEYLLGKKASTPELNDKPRTWEEFKKQQGFQYGFRFKVKKSLSMDIDSNQRLNKKEYGEDNTTLYEISGLLSKDIVIKVFKDNKLILSNTLYLINKTNDGDLYLYEKTGAGFINLWTIFPKMNIVICNKQYISITPLKTKNIEVRQYISHIESYF